MALLAVAYCLKLFLPGGDFFVDALIYAFALIGTFEMIRAMKEKITKAERLIVYAFVIICIPVGVLMKYFLDWGTTAAGVWATAGVGMACGAQLYVLAIGAALLMVGAQWLLHRNWKIFKQKRYYSINIVFKQTSNEREKIKEIFDIDRYNRLVLSRDGENLIYHATLNTDVEYSSSQLNEIMENNSFIFSLERCDDN